MNDQQIETSYNKVTNLADELVQEAFSSTSSQADAFADLIGIAAMFHEASSHIWLHLKEFMWTEDPNE